MEKFTQKKMSISVSGYSNTKKDKVAWTTKLLMGASLVIRPQKKLFSCVSYKYEKCENREIEKFKKIFNI